MNCYFTEFPPTLKCFQATVHHRITAAYRPATLKAQKSALKLLASFCILYELKFPVVSVPTTLSFVEFLADNYLAPATIKNYLSSVNSNFRRLGIDVTSFNSNLIKLALKSLERNAPKTYKPKPVLSIVQIQQLLNVATAQPMYIFFRLEILLALIGMLRISNIACISISNFDVLRHIARGDVVIPPSGLDIKWSKTLQSYSQSAIINLPKIQGSPLCPVAAFQALIANYQVPPPNTLYYLIWWDLNFI
jgi:hypothetical protein